MGITTTSLATEAGSTSRTSRRRLARKLERAFAVTEGVMSCNLSKPLHRTHGERSRRSARRALGPAAKTTDNSKGKYSRRDHQAYRTRNSACQLVQVRLRILLVGAVLVGTSLDARIDSLVVVITWDDSATR